MTSRLDRFVGRKPAASDSRFGMEWWLSQMATWSFGGNNYAQPVRTTYGTTADEPIGNSFDGYARGAYMSNGPVFALALVLQSTIAEGRFAYQNVDGEVYGTADLAVLEDPWPGGSTQELLARMEQDVALAGNWYAVRRGDEIVRLRPDWVTVISGARQGVVEGVQLSELDSTVVGYMYCPDGDSDNAVLLSVDEVAHYSPIPDPLARWRGMSWLTPVLREVEADAAMSRHKLEFFNHAATPNLVVTLDKSVSEDAAKAFAERFNDDYAGVANAYKNIVLGGGADVTVVGQSFEQIAFKATQGAGETRLAAVAGVPPVIAGFAEGLQSATYSNYSQARRRYADITCHPRWKAAATAIAALVPRRPGSKLIVDTRDIPFLRDDARDSAEVTKAQAITMDLLVRAGFEPDAIGLAVASGDLSSLPHTGAIPTTLYPDGQDPSHTGQAQPSEEE